MHVVRAAHADSATLTDVVRDARCEPGERVAVDLEGPQVAGVDADERGAGVDRAARLLLVVHLDERRHAEALGALEQAHERVLLQRGDDEQHQVGAVRRAPPRLVRRDDEVLAQHRDVDGGAHGLEVVEAAVEPAPRSAR